jgi:hypothetical protein
MFEYFASDQNDAQEEVWIQNFKTPVREDKILRNQEDLGTVGGTSWSELQI